MSTTLCRGTEVAAVDDLERLMGRISRGESDALAELYDRTCRQVYGVAVRVLGREDEAEEVVLDVFAQVWRTASNFRTDRGSVAAWLTIIARSRALDRLRARRTRPDLDDRNTTMLDEHPEIVDESRAGEPFHALDARHRVTSLLSVLPPPERQLIELAFFKGYTHGELSRLFEIPLGTIKTRIRASLLKMRRVQLGSVRIGEAVAEG